MRVNGLDIDRRLLLHSVTHYMLVEKVWIPLFALL
jgi:hypothetical protein